MSLIGHVRAPHKNVLQRFWGIFPAIALVGLMTTTIAQAKAPKDDLFTASVPVKSQSSSERARAAKQALMAVLVRLSGLPSIAQSPGVKPSLGRAIRLADQFHYAAMDPDSVDPASEMTQLLVVNFLPQTVRKILRDAQLPFWPPNRPPVLVWLVEDSVEQGRVFVNDAENPLILELLNVARDRGVSLKFPLLDIDDQLALSADQAWDLDERSLANASERYNAGTFLVGRYTLTTSGQWLSYWQYYHGGSSGFADRRSDLPGQLAEAGITPLANYLAKRYAIVSNQESRALVTMHIENVTDFKTYKSSLDYLSKLALVKDLQIASVNGGQLVIALAVDGELKQLQNALSLDSKLMPVQESVFESPLWQQMSLGSEENPLRYHWASH